MKESMWGYLIIALGVVIIAILVFVQRLTTVNEQDYHLSREIMKSSMLDAVDYGTYMKTGKLVMSREKFVAIFTRRFAESVSPDRTYTLNFYDIHEYPPKATVRIGTTTGETSIKDNSVDLDVNTFISAILVTSEADGIIKMDMDVNKVDVNGDGDVNPKDILVAINAYLDGTNNSKVASLAGDSNIVELEDVEYIEQIIMSGFKLGDIDKDGYVSNNDVLRYDKGNFDLFQKIVADVNQNGQYTGDNNDKVLIQNLANGDGLGFTCKKNGKTVAGKCGDVNGDGMVTAADALIIKQYINNKGFIRFDANQEVLADYSGNGDGSINNSDISSILRTYRSYLTNIIGNNN